MADSSKGLLSAPDALVAGRRSDEHYGSWDRFVV